MMLEETIIIQQQLTTEDRMFLHDIIIGNWVQNSDTGLIDVRGSVYLHNKNLTKIPYKFGIVTGNFSCHSNQLISLKGCPIEVTDNFYCYNSQLISLKGCPIEVKGNFYCFGNQLQSTKYLPSMIINYNDCIKEINNQKIKYLIDLSFDPDNKEYFQELMTELE